ncbi:hypothetical protein DINM_001686 [Dirofilaria immitis]|nr:hypothetical protein [Dirofilaria immitis]
MTSLWGIKREAKKLTYFMFVDLRRSHMIVCKVLYVKRFTFTFLTKMSEGPGETISIAVDMAAMDALMRYWEVTADKKFPFSELDSLNDLDLLFVDLEEEQEPINVKEVAARYKKEIEAVVGIPLRRRLRHKFSRGTFGKRSFRYINKPKIYQIC